MAPLEQDKVGFWGQPTATIDWCEANYEITYYIAEFWNTVSNISMILPPLFGLTVALKDGIEPRYVGSYLSLLIVGIGSTLFHGTLLYGMQLLDELPMIWGSAFLLYALIEIDSMPGKKTGGVQLGLFLYCFMVTVVYLTIHEPLFHEVAYAIMVFAMLYYSIGIVRNLEHSTLLFAVGLSMYAIGFFIWNIDNVFCKHIRIMRQSVGYPISPVFQGHAWWHILAGMGTHLAVMFSQHTRAKFLKQQVSVKNKLGILPYIKVDGKV